MKPTRKEQWKINAANRRARILEQGGRVLPVILEHDESAKLDQIIALRKKADPGINMTSWVRKMIESDLKLLLRRRNVGAGGRST